MVDAKTGGLRASDHAQHPGIESGSGECKGVLPPRPCSRSLGQDAGGMGAWDQWDPTGLANEYGGLIRFDENIMGFSGINLANIML